MRIGASIESCTEPTVHWKKDRAAVTWCPKKQLVLVQVKHIVLHWKKELLDSQLVHKRQ